MKFRVRKWKLQRERDLNYPCVKFILVPTMTNQLKEPRFCPTLAPPRLLMVKSFILTWKKNPKWPILCFSINMHAFNNFYINNVYIYRYFACHNRISGKKSLKVIYHSIEEYGKTAIFDQYIQSSWKLIWTWEVGFRLFFLTTPCQTILRPELQPERGCVEKSTFCIVCVSNNPHVKQKINAIHLICTLNLFFSSN